MLNTWLKKTVHNLGQVCWTLGAIALLVLAMTIAWALGYSFGFFLDPSSSRSEHWTMYFKALGPTLIAFFVAYIAWQQWQSSRATLREKLFDRRLQIFSEVNESLKEIMRSGTVSQTELDNFRNTLNMAVFLFGKEIETYLKGIWSNAVRLKYLNDLYNKNIVQNTAMPPALVNEMSDKFAHLVRQFEDIFNWFEPYLRFEQKN
ncbi:hypothetical protein [Falsihalocynthiibacter sp. BN13B15]|uniref:hypothetical protein n=1 Tax=Falsihalocynthiibacter sp. BN13B15 TaxID=3240871 RepID=UPI003510A2B4